MVENRWLDGIIKLKKTITKKQMKFGDEDSHQIIIQVTVYQGVKATGLAKACLLIHSDFVFKLK